MCCVIKMHTVFYDKKKKKKKRKDGELESSGASHI